MKWKSALCPCIVNVSVTTDRNGMAQFRHEGTVTTCPEHGALSGQALVNALVAESRRYTDALRVIENQKRELLEKILGKPEVAEVDDSTQAEVKLDENRNVVIALPTTITKEDEDAIKAALDKDVVVTLRSVLTIEEPSPIITR